MANDRHRVQAQTARPRWLATSGAWQFVSARQCRPNENQAQPQLIRPACTIFLLAAALLGCGGGGDGGGNSASAPPAAAATAAAQVYALTNPGDNAAELGRLAALPTVDGLAFRPFWSGLEPSDGVFDWTSLDAALDAVRTQAKGLTIHVNPTEGGLPGWLSAAGAAVYTYIPPAGPNSTAPLPWDAVYLGRYGAFITAMASHVSARGSDAALVKYVSVPVPVPEMSLSICGDGVIKTTSATTPSIAYDRASYLSAWKTTLLNQITAFNAAAFSSVKVLVSAPARDICHHFAIGGGDNDGAAFYAEAMAYALTLRQNMGVFAADLNGGASQADGAGSLRLKQATGSTFSGLPINLQTIASATADPARMDGTLLQAVCKGRAAGGRNFEIYKEDLDNQATDIQAAIAAARNGNGC